MIVTFAWPPPSHMVCSPNRPPMRSSSCSMEVISRAPVAGRVHYGERVRDALVRHLEKDLGPMALPQLPASPQPFMVVEYFPDPTVTGFHDPRQHAVSLAFVVPVTGDCVPSASALDLQWMTPEEAASEVVGAEMTGGQDRLLRLALAHVGVLP